MKKIQEKIQEESLLAFPVVTNIKGNDCNARNREEWVDACNKGVEIMQEMMETLKDFDTWKEWKNTDPIESIPLDELNALEDAFPEFKSSRQIFDSLTSVFDKPKDL